VPHRHRGMAHRSGCAPGSDEIRKVLRDQFLPGRGRHSNGGGRLGELPATGKVVGLDDPLFPATRVVPGPDLRFQVAGLDRKHWSNAGPIRKIFKNAFASVGLRYFNPHSFRKTLALLGGQLCKTAEEYKAWSQSLGHEHVLTTLCSYGDVSCHRQTEIMRLLVNCAGAPQLRWPIGAIPSRRVRGCARNRGGRAGELRRERRRRISPRRHSPPAASSKGAKPAELPVVQVAQVRSGDQPIDRADARPYGTRQAARGR